jgi:hypothetical protein
MTIDKPNHEEAMEEDAPTSSKGLNENIVIQPKIKMPKINPISIQKMYDKTRDKDGNIRLSCVKKLYKKHKKKERKMCKFLIPT